MNAMAANAMDAGPQLEWQCAHILAGFFRLLDESRYDELVGLFDATGVWHRQGKSLSGHDSLLSAMKARPAGQLIRHVLGEPHVELQSREQASVSASVTVYVGKRDIGAALPLGIRGPFRVLDTKASLHRDAVGSWKIMELTNLPIFDFPGEMP